MLPVEFIPVADENSLILPMNRMMMREAGPQLKAWTAQFPHLAPLTISVNFTTRQFAQSDLVDDNVRILQETGIEPSCLQLEIHGDNCHG